MRLAYVQSDEISLLLTDFGGMQSEAWFDGSIQKIASISASRRPPTSTRAAGCGCSRRPLPRAPTDLPIAYFDSRAFIIPAPVEFENYFVWRGRDATRNSISMTAQACFPHERLQGKSSDEM